MNDRTRQKPLATSRNVLVLAAVVAALGITVAGVSFLDSPKKELPSTLRVENTPTEAANVAGAKTSETFSYRGVEGQTALELLKENYDVKTKEYSFGEMVTSINGIKAGDDKFWAFYVNGKMSQVGAGEYLAQGDELFEWRLEKIE